MSRQPSNVTQTTRTEPSPFLVPSIQRFAGQIGSDFSRQTGLPNTVRPNVPVPGSTNGGFIGGLVGPLTNRELLKPGQNPFVPPTVENPPAGNNALDLIPGAQGLVGRTVAGDFLTPDTNPFLQQTFNRAADLTRTRLASEFARSGRDLSASLPARSDELQTLAANIFGTNFQRERDRQIAAIGQTPAVDPTNIAIDRIAALAPAAGGTAVSSTPVSRNIGGGALGGAALGSAFGLPGIIGGGLLGGIFG